VALRTLKEEVREIQNMNENRYLTWVLGFTFVTIISASSLIGLLLVPNANDHSRGSNLWHNAFEGLALGSLLASALFHLIPHAFDLIGEDSNHDYLYKSLLIFAGIQLFHLSERLMVLVSDWYTQRKVSKSASKSNQPPTNGVPLSPVTEEESTFKLAANT